MTHRPCDPPGPRIELFWIPLGAGGQVVRCSGRLFEAAAAARQHRRRLDLYHCALVVTSDIGRLAIELAPAEGGDRSARGVEVTGPVGLGWAGRIRLFRYEIRCRPDGLIPDLSAAVQSPVALSTDPALVRLIPRLVGQVPPLTWGRDESGAGEMWNSNSVISWLILRAGIDASQVALPRGGRAPGWNAGIVVARRQS